MHWSTLNNGAPELRVRTENSFAEATSATVPADKADATATAAAFCCHVASRGAALATHAVRDEVLLALHRFIVAKVILIFDFSVTNAQPKVFATKSGAGVLHFNARWLAIGWAHPPQVGPVMRPVATYAEYQWCTKTVSNEASLQTARSRL